MNTKSSNKDSNRNTKRSNKTPTVLRKAGENLDRYKILNQYLYESMSNSEIATYHNTTSKRVEDIISKLYRDFISLRETKMLIASGNNPEYFQTMKESYLDPETVNNLFLEKLSEEDTPVLTNAEIIFCHVLVDTGDEVRAIKESKLQVGLKKGKGGNIPLDAMRARAYYLKKKPNLVTYIGSIRHEKLDVLKESKKYVQSNLIDLIDKLRNSDDPKSAGNMLKAIETLGKTSGVFDEKSTLEIISGDDSLDRILNKAKKAKESNSPIELDESTEIYQ